MTDPMTTDPLIPCCDWLDHSPGPCACPDHPMSSLHPFGHIGPSPESAPEATEDDESHVTGPLSDLAGFLQTFARLTEFYRAGTPAPTRPFLVNEWERTLLDAACGGPKQAEKWAQAYGFSGIENYETAYTTSGNSRNLPRDTK